MKFLVLDNGLYITQALGLAKGGNKVYYFTNWPSAFPKYEEFAAGEGFEDEGMENVLYPLRHFDTADCIVNMDVHGNDTIAFLRKKFPNKSIVGCGLGEVLENDRWGFKKIQKELGLKVQKTVKLKGVDELRKYLQENKDVYVKLNIWRESHESFYAKDYKSVELIINEIECAFGPRKNKYEFIVEEAIHSDVEVGFDGFFNGKDYLRPFFIGYEYNKNLYVAKVSEEMPEQVKETMEKIKPILQKLDYRGPLSTEEKIVSKKEHYFLDMCFDKETEILTNEGWKLFKDLNKNELVATINKDTNIIEWNKPIRYIDNEFDGDLVSIESNKKSIDIKVTPNHNMWVIKQNKNKPEFIRADSLPHGCKIPRTAINNSKDILEFNLDEYKNFWKSGKYNKNIVSCNIPSVKLNMDSWIMLIALYLSEGSCQVGGINISQTKNVEYIEAVLKNLPFKYRYDGKSFRISGTQLNKYFKVFGKCNEKFVPDFIKKLSSRQIRLFLEAYCMGDGHFDSNGQIEIFTTSKKMADDIQELFFLSGSIANIYIQKVAGTTMSISNKLYKRKFDIYKISERKYNKQFYLDKSENHISKYRYKDRVYCVEVKNNTIVVRRNGKPYICGNCARLPAPLSALYPQYINNWPELIYKCGLKQNVKLDIKHKYVGAFSLQSEHAKKHWLKIDVEEKDRDNIKFRMVCKNGGHYYSIPGCDSVVVIVAGGETPKQVIDTIKKYASKVSAYGLDKDPVNGIDKILEIIENGKKVGISF